MPTLVQDAGGGDFSPPPVAVAVPPPSVAVTTAPSIPQPGVTYVDTEPGVFIPAPSIAPTATAPATEPTISTQGQPIPQAGSPLIDVGDGTYIVAPPVTGTDAVTHEQEPASDDESDLADLEGLQFLSDPPLSGSGFVNYVRSRCDALRLDDLAVFANAMAEGLSGGMGDNGTSFGPWNMHQGGGLPKKYWSYPAFSPLVQAWTWTRQGIDWALNGMVKGGAQGKRGHAAVHAIVEGFERPANIGGQEVIRDDYYDALRGMSDPYGYLAQRAAGAKVSGETTVPVPKSGKSAVGAVGKWRDLIDTLWKDVPSTRNKVQAASDNLIGVFK